MKILIVDDTEPNRLILEIILHDWGYETVSFADGQEAWDYINSQEDKPTIAIVDWMMPIMDGLELCRKIRANIQEPYIYLILLTAKNRKEDLIEGMESGADDFISKPFDKKELEVRLRAGARVVKLQQELIKARDELRIEATFDSLTSVYNRRMIMNMLENEISRAIRQQSILGLIMADLDHFKQINDKYGHQVGDEVLKEVCLRLKASVRVYDSVGRYGGEEFLLLLPNCNKTDLIHLANRLLDNVRRIPICVNENNIPMTISIGSTCSNNEVKKFGASNLIKIADKALYDAKNSGRDRMCFYDLSL